VVAGLWVVDGLVQAALGTSPLFWSLEQLKWALQGRELCAPEDMQVLDRLGGVFGLCNPKLGQVLASLSPFLLFAAGRRFGRTGWLLAAATAGIVIVLAGSRASWLTYLLVLVFSGWRVLGGRGLLVVMALALSGALALGVVSPQVRARVEQTAQALQADGGGVDAALSGRGRIWGAALCMFGEHPVNGVGARGFREAYPACDPAPGEPGAWGEGPALHAHQIVLEILSETGAIGLLLWLAGTALAWRAWRYATAAAREQARPAMLALAVTVFPINTHLAFYSTFWGGVTLLLAALYAGALLGRTTEAQAAG
jgi:Lipid A core - O-antigen ligase and related enzymes